MTKGKIRSKKAKSTISNSKKNEAPQSKVNFPIVAIGASAGGLKALEAFFSNLVTCDMAYVVITHLDREHISVLPTLMEKFSKIPVVTIKNGTVVKPNTIYVTPPNANIAIESGKLALIEQDEPHYKNLPISYFFRSLALSIGENAIAVVLSGTGTDGSSGLRDIKECGGLTIAQDPATADFDGMPRCAINTGLIDYVITAEDISIHLKKYMDYGKITEGKLSPEFQQVLNILRLHTNHDFSNYKLNTVCRRIEKHMFSHHIETLSDYVRFLRINPTEIDNLLNELLIGVTRFFRDTEAFEALRYKVFPALFKNKPKDHSLRIWIPACSTGEEAYSIAITLQDAMVDTGTHFNVQIFATDIDLGALDVARSGNYPDSISSDVSPERLKRYFTKNLNHYKIKNDIRSMIIFGEQNIIKDPPFTKLDMISCRNLLIYLDAKMQKKILPLFHYSLKQKGLLFLGMSEATTGFTDYFNLIVKKYKIFERKNTTSTPRALLGFDTMPRIYHEPPRIKHEEAAIAENPAAAQAIQSFIIENHMHPCMVINKKGDVIYAQHQAKRFFKKADKRSTFNISTDTYPELKMVLIPAIHRIRTRKRAITHNNLSLKMQKKSSEVVNLQIIPITTLKGLADHMLVIFESVEKSKVSKFRVTKSSTAKTNEKLEEVVQELEHTKDNLQASIEELEAGNEELQSANEELQSTNEEIETSKEELQSLNEELIIVNTELQAMIDQLATVNDDMTNLFNSTEIAAFFLDNDLNIKRFTPKAHEFMHLIQSDIGRSFSHFASKIASGKIVENAEVVLKTLVQKKYEVKSEDDRWYQVHILPYRTLTNVIDGVIITLADITTFKEYEMKLDVLNDIQEASLLLANSIINTVREPFLLLDLSLNIVSTNESFYRIFKTNAPQTIGKLIYEVGDGKFDTESLRKLLGDVKNHKIVFEDYNLKNISKRYGYTSLLLNARIIQGLTPDQNLILLGMDPVK